MTAKELREKRAALAKQIRQMADKVNNENRDFTAEEKPHWEKVNKDYDDLSRQIDLAERAETVEAEQRDTGRDLPGRGDRDVRDEDDREEREENDGDEMTDEELGLNERKQKPEVFGLALQGWMRYQSGLDVEERHLKAARLVGVNVRRRHLDVALNRRAMTMAEFRALSAVDASVGAATIAPSFSGAFERAMLAFGGMRQVAQVIRTATGANMPWPTVNDTSNEGAIIGENVAGATTPDPSFGAQSWGAFKYTSKIIQVPAELLEDSAFDLATEVGSLCGERIARRQNRDFTTGNAAGKPNGIVTAGAAFAAAANNAIAADDIVGLIHSVDPAYRNDPSFGLMMNDQILLAVRKLKDGQGRYLFAPATDGAPATIWGARYTINQHMDSTFATGKKTIVAGQLNKYKIRDVNVLRLRRLVERYADADQEGFVAFFRSDGNLLNAGVNPVSVLTH